MYEFFVTCKKTFRLYLRRIYVTKKAHRESLLSRPLRNTDSPGCPRGVIPLVLTLSAILTCYIFLVPARSEQNEVYSEKSIEIPVSFDARKVSGKTIPKEAKVKLAKEWLARNTPKEMFIDVETEPTVTEKSTKSYMEIAENVPAYVIDISDKTTSSSTSTTGKPICLTRVSPEKLTITTSIIKVSLDGIYPAVQKGGYYRPTGCLPEHKVAIIVPYRDRIQNLEIFLINIHPFLMTENIEYRIFIIEQHGNNTFNKGRLLNAGFKESKKYGDWDCVIFHDVDLLPMDRRIFYTCPVFPRHMSSSVIGSKSWKNTTSPILFGGVTAMSVQHYVKVNGHSNHYWGWGGEDYDMFWRIKTAKIPIRRYNKGVAKYLALPHPHSPPNPLRYELIRSALERLHYDGLNSIEYKVVSSTLHHLYTHIIVDIEPTIVTNTIASMKDAIRVSIVRHRRRNQHLISLKPFSNNKSTRPTPKLKVAKPILVTPVLIM